MLLLCVLQPLQELLQLDHHSWCTPEYTRAAVGPSLSYCWGWLYTVHCTLSLEFIKLLKVHGCCSSQTESEIHPWPQLTCWASVPVRATEIRKARLGYRERRRGGRDTVGGHGEFGKACNECRRSKSADSKNRILYKLYSTWCPKIFVRIQGYKKCKHVQYFICIICKLEIIISIILYL